MRDYISSLTALFRGGKSFSFILKDSKLCFQICGARHFLISIVNYSIFCDDLQSYFLKEINNFQLKQILWNSNKSKTFLKGFLEYFMIQLGSHCGSRAWIYLHKWKRNVGRSLNLKKCWVYCMNWKPLPKHMAKTLRLCFPAHPFQKATILHSAEGPSCCNQAVQPSLTICWATMLGNGNHWLSGATVRPTIRCTRPGYLCNVFQRRQPCLCLLFTSTTPKQTFGLLALLFICFIVLAAQNEIAILVHRAILVPKNVQSKHNERGKKLSYFSPLQITD